MSDYYKVQSKSLTNIADAIRKKTGETKKMSLKQMSEAIAGISGNAICNKSHIIEVAKLPTENNDEEVLYSCEGAYYKWVNEFTDLIVYDGGVMSYKEMSTQVDITMTFNTIATKITDGILESDMATSMHCYYIEDEADVFIYADTWYSLADMGMTNGGVISDISEATTDGSYYALIGTWKSYREAPSGATNVTENGTYDVTDKESVSVEVITWLTVQNVADLPETVPVGTLAFVLGGK